MNGIEKITARIETDGKAEIAAILKEGEEKAAQIVSEYAARADAQAQADFSAGEAAAASRKERLESAAKMDAKKALLETKQSLLDEAFAAAKKQLLALPEKEYVELLANLAARSAVSGHEELIFRAADHKRVGEKVVAQANALLTGTSQHPAALTLSEETREMEGGLMLRDGKVEVNCAFDTQLRVLRGNMAAEIAAILFA